MKSLMKKSDTSEKASVSTTEQKSEKSDSKPKVELFTVKVNPFLKCLKDEYLITELF